MSTLGDNMMNVGDIMSTAGVFRTPGRYHEYTGGYHEYTGGCSVHWGFHTNSVVFPMTFPHIYHDIPQCASGGDWGTPHELYVPPHNSCVPPIKLKNCSPHLC